MLFKPALVMRDPVRQGRPLFKYLLNPRQAVCFKRVDTAYQQYGAIGSRFGIERLSGFFVARAPVPRHVG